MQKLFCQHCCADQFAKSSRKTHRMDRQIARQLLLQQKLEKQQRESEQKCKEDLEKAEVEKSKQEVEKLNQTKQAVKLKALRLLSTQQKEMRLKTVILEKEKERLEKEEQKRMEIEGRERLIIAEEQRRIAKLLEEKRQEALILEKEQLEADHEKELILFKELKREEISQRSELLELRYKSKKIAQEMQNLALNAMANMEMEILDNQLPTSDTKFLEEIKQIQISADDEIKIFERKQKITEEKQENVKLRMEAIQLSIYNLGI